MLLMRALVLMLLLGALVSFALYVGSGQIRFKRYGWIILKGAVLMACGFFAILILERIV